MGDLQSLSINKCPWKPNDDMEITLLAMGAFTTKRTEKLLTVTALIYTIA